MKVIADHGRSMTVMIGDGILPSNEGRGYVLRRILRRAVRHGRLMGIEKTFLVDIVDIVAAIFAEAYPDITDKKEYIKKVIRQEEERFQTTLAQGMELLNGHITEMVKSGNKTLNGTIAFQLYDTFGFPWELTLEILLEHDLELDKAGFDQAMSIQRERARAARQDNEEKIVLPDLSRLSGEKLSHDFGASNAKVVLLWKDGKVMEAAHDDEEIGVILSVTPFYAEGGGQIGDTGTLTGPMGRVQIATAKRLPDGTIYHWGRIIEGTLKTGDMVAIEVDETRRGSTARNHTATHLLQAALRSVLGDHVNQAGSMVTPERLRFDFTHFAPVTQEQVSEIEKIVNRQILKNSQVQKREMPQEEAKKLGATALFGEKYGDIVRVVLVDDFSKELCGGVHVSSTGEIGVFKIVAEAGIGSGVRRIEAVTGFGALEYIRDRETTLLQAAHALKTRPEELLTRIDALQTGIKELEQELNAVKAKLAKGEVEELLSGVETIQGVKVAVGVVAANDMDALRSVADMVRDRLGSGVVGIGAVNHEKVNFVVMATKDVVAKGVHAGNIVKEAAKVAGGGGGGRPDMAQAGAKQADKIGESLETMKNVIRQQIK